MRRQSKQDRVKELLGELPADVGRQPTEPDLAEPASQPIGRTIGFKSFDTEIGRRARTGTTVLTEPIS